MTAGCAALEEAALEDAERAVGVFGQVISGDPARLPLVVRRFHFSLGDVAGTGIFQVRRSPTPLGRLMATLLHLPRPNDAAPVTLVVRRPPPATCGEPMELWYRRFGDESVDSLQAVDDSRVVERVGRIELCFELAADGGRLEFVHVATRVRLGPVRLRLPRALSIRVRASVGASPDEQRLHVRVLVSAPLVGTLLAYCGELAEVAAP